MRALLVLLALAALACGASAARGLNADAGALPAEGRSGPALGPARRLAQTAADCNRSVPYCTVCRFQMFRGTLTRAVCLTCATGYKVAASGRACWCAPGYAFNATTRACDRCGLGAVCPGARSTQASATRTQCGANKNTSTDVAMSDRECLVLPGYGWAAGDGSAVCPAGSYNPGFNTRQCTRCAGGLTTRSAGATSPMACESPAGFYFLRGKAVACAQGTYKAAIGNTDCDKCLAGWTTAPGAVGATAQSQCSFVLPGFSADANATAGAAPLSQCAANWFRAGTVAYNATAGAACSSCPAGMATLPGVLGATSPDACLALPGYGWNSSTQAAAICPTGSYSAGWSRAPCAACDAAGGTITTGGPGATGSDDCVIPAGHSAARIGDGLYTGSVCPPDTYGRSANVTGLVEVNCDKCMQYTSTRGANASTSSAACVTDPGYGYDDGQVTQCDYGYWAAGGDVRACSFCGEGYNTTADGSVPTTSAVVGASAEGQCAVAAGWTYADAADASRGLAPCVRGTYKALIGNATCSRCPAGTTTTITMAAVAQSDCDACRPGFGAASINPGTPSCTICASGTYAPGFQTGGGVCSACPKPSLFTGKMVSRAGIFTPEDCVPEFPTDGDLPSYQIYNRIPMLSSSLTVQPAINTSLACQAACAADTGCQYFEFYSYSANGAGNDTCHLRLLGQAIERDAAFTTATTGDYILLEVDEGMYAVYKALSSADAIGIGVPIASYGDFASAHTACRGGSACVGVSGSGGTWRTFGGQRWEGVVGKVRVVGETLNSWIAAPSP